LIRALKGVVPRVKARDRALGDQLARASSSIVLNIGEGNYSDPGNRRARFFNAAGSAGETRLALTVAATMGHCTADEADVALALLDRVIAMLWKLTH
jgi:four helix bundle protein